jgi:hypothetical protein
MGAIRHGVTDIPEVRTFALRIGARLRSMRKLVVEGHRGKYRRDLAVIKFSTTGEITAPDDPDYAPTDAERKAIEAAWGRYEWPKYEPKLHTSARLPRNEERAPWSFAEPGNLAVCRDASGDMILCVEERRPRDDGRKDIWIWTYWSDGKWRVAEPPDLLPLYGLETIGNAATVFVHEGAKAAKAAQELVADESDTGWASHPWGSELRGHSPGAVAHVGWIGGAGRPEATDWGALIAANPRFLTLVCDNDQDSQDAVRAISRRLMRTLKAVEFDDRFPSGFDIADRLPEKLFTDRDGRRIYTGPKLRELMQPATWATRQLPQGMREDGRRQRGQSGFAIRPEFAAEWLYINELGVFVNRLDPLTFYSADQFNALVRPVSDVKDTAALMLPLRSCRANGVMYDPGKPGGVFAVGGKRMFNVHVPSKIEAAPGDPRPFLRYLRHLIPNRRDRFEVMRFVATLLARPDIRMLYGLILMSARHGVGKSTLFEYILAPLLGDHNCSSTDAQEVTESQFTDWIAHKRLVVIDEIYAGHSSHTANALKPRITRKTEKVNKKFQVPYYVENWAHFVIMSNSKTPIFIESMDRRWLVPEVTEALRPLEYWQRLHRWLNNGGLGIIRHWAERFVASKRGPVPQGSHAPVTEAKAELIDRSRSGGTRLLDEVTEWLADLGQGAEPKRVIIPVREFKKWYLSQADLSAGDKKMSERAILEALPAALKVCAGDERCEPVKGRKVTVIINFEKAPEEKWPALVKAGYFWDARRLEEEFNAYQPV